MTRWSVLPMPLIVVALCLVSEAATIRVPDHQPTIQAGIDAATAGDTVLVACGAYYEHDIVMKSGVCLVSETGQPDCVTVDAQGLGRGFCCNGLSGETRLEGVTIANGAALGEWWPDCAGGGVYMLDSSPVLTALAIVGCVARDGAGLCCDQSSPTLESMSFVGNSAADAGGGMQFRSSTAVLFAITLSGNSGGTGGGIYVNASSISLEEVSFSGNTSPTGMGGGMSCDDSDVSLAGCVFSENTAGYGGGLHLPHGSRSSVDDTDFNTNSAIQGGAVYCSVGSPSFTSTTFSGNTASDDGGAVYCWGADETPLFSQCDFRGNAAGVDGGAINCLSEVQPILHGCVFAGNEAAECGGGLYCDGFASPILEECTFARNTAGSYGGGMLCSFWHNDLINCTFYGNEAGTSGGAVYGRHNGWADFENCLVAFTCRGGAVGGDGTLDFTMTCSDVYGNVGGDWSGPIGGQLGVEGNIMQNPMLCNPSFDDFRIDAASPCTPEGNECGVMMGAHGVGCGGTAVESTSWGSVKALFR